MNNVAAADRTDARILLALADEPRATVVALADRLRLSRNTVQARLAKLEERGVLGSLERRVDPAAVGFPLTAFVTARVDQHRLADVSDDLADIPEVVEVYGISGGQDLLVRVVATDNDDLYRIAGRVLAVPGVERTTTALAMRELVPYRITALLDRAARGEQGGGAGWRTQREPSRERSGGRTARRPGPGEYGGRASGPSGG